MYKSQFPKIDPYDWFCGPGSHLVSCRDKFLLLWWTQIMRYPQKKITFWKLKRLNTQQYHGYLKSRNGLWRVAVDLQLQTESLCWFPRRVSHPRAGLGPVDTHRMCISMSHQDCKVSQVTAGASGVSLVRGEEFASLCWPVSCHAPLRIVPKWAVWIEVVLRLINRETCHCIWMWQLTSARFRDLNLYTQTLFSLINNLY